MGASRIRNILVDCRERTRDMTVPQYRDGECEVRRLWDESAAEATGWNADELAELRNLLHEWLHARALGCKQYPATKVRTKARRIRERLN